MPDTKPYKVENKEEFRKLNLKTQDVDTWFRIWATSKGGTYFHVEISETELTKADDVLTKRAKELDSI